MISLKERINNIKNIKKNFNTIRRNPFAYVKFEYYAFRAIMILLAVFLSYTFLKIIFDFGRITTMTLITRGITLLIMVVVLFNMYKMVSNKKKIMEHYLANPVTIDNHANEKNIDVRAEVDDILSKYDENGNLKGGKK